MKEQEIGRAWTKSADSPRSLTASESVPASTVAHSPLPWRALSDYVLAANGSVVAPIAQPMSESLHMDRGDARYIVTACNAYPELIAALRAFDNISQFSAGDCFEIPADEWREAMALVRAALAKAEGR